MLLRLENILQKFITKIESVLDRGSVWGRANNPLRSKRCKRGKKYNFYIFSDLKFSFVIGNFFPWPEIFAPFTQTGRMVGPGPMHNAHICEGLFVCRVQWTKHNALMYVQSTKARRIQLFIVANNLSVELIFRMRRLMSFSCNDRS